MTCSPLVKAGVSHSLCELQRTAEPRNVAEFNHCRKAVMPPQQTLNLGASGLGTVWVALVILVEGWQPRPGPRLAQIGDQLFPKIWQAQQLGIRRLTYLADRLHTLGV